MAIQNRRGVYTDFDESKMVAGEIAVVQSGDPSNTDGKAIYIAFQNGSVARLVLADEMGTLSDLETTVKTSVVDAINELAGRSDILYGSTITAGSTRDKIVTCEDFEAVDGTLIIVLFNQSNTATNARLNVNGTGACDIVRRGTTNTSWLAEAPALYLFRYTKSGSYGQYKLVGAIDVQASNDAPKMNGTTSAGTSDKYSRGDHVHPSDTTKVDKIVGKGLSTEDYTTAEKTKLSGIEEQATKTVIDATLVNAGQAADAKKVGDEITNLKDDLNDLTTRVSDIEEEEGLHRYGVSGIGQAASQLTRLWDAVGMTAQVGTDGENSGVINNFDDVTPFNRRKCVGTWHKGATGRPVFHVHAYLGDDDYTEDGTNGDYVAVECPRAYYYYKDGVLGISAHQYPEWRPFDIFCHDHNPEDTMPYYYMPAYALALDENGNAVCLPGYDNEQGTYKSLVDAARTYQDGALGSNAILLPMAINFYEWALYTVEFAKQNCQSTMYGCGELRHSNDDRVTFIDATHVITNNYQAARVAMECVAIIGTTIDINDANYKATHRIVSVTRCDENGNASASGTHQLIELEDFGRDYYEYDLTGATEYRFAARPYRTGDCNGVSTPSGSPINNTSGYYPCKYRWHENPFGNQYHTVMDLFDRRVGTNDADYYLEWYFLPDPSLYEPSTTSKPDTAELETDMFELLDVQTEHENYVNGWIKSKKHSGEYPDLWIQYETTGATNTTYYCDYAYLVSSPVVRAVRLGGVWHSGPADGFSYANAYYAPSYGNALYGGDLCVIQ